jgi:hypothetical protein
MEYIRSEVNSLGALNAELEKIEVALEDKLSTEATGPRVMHADLDMNSNQILNLPAPSSPTEPVRVIDIPALVDQAQGANYVGETAPTAVFQGMRWFNPAVPTTYVWYQDSDSGQWVEETAQGVDGLLRQELNAGRLVTTVEKYNAVGDGDTDDAAAFAAMQAALGYITLSVGKKYFVTSLPNVATLIINGNGSTVNYDRLLIDRAFTLLDLKDINFDARNSNLTRCIRVRGNSKIKFRKVNGYNINSTTFVRMFDISTENVDIDMEDMYCESLVAAENAVIGDNNGATRFIYVGDEGGALTKTSFGRIVNIRGKTLMPKEDGDMIHIQSSDTKKFAIVVSNISGVNIAKRVVKVQANGVEVSHVSCDAVNNAVSMYAVVSHYGEYGSVSNVFAVGKLEQGVDTQYETTQVYEINCHNTGTAVSQGAALKGSGGLFGRNITGYGFEHVVGNYISLVSNANTDVEGVFGQGTGIPVFIRAALVSGRVNLENIKASSTGNFRLVQVARTSSNTYTYVDIEDVAGDCNTFTAVDVTGSAVTEANNVNINQTASGIPLTVNGGEAYIADVAGRGTCTDAVFLNVTTKAVITRARGGASAQVITTGCNNTIVNNAICAAGVPASRNTGTASTNTQNVGTLTFV